ncbi:MAG: gamma-glutamyltransferase [Psychromonas sp.]
MSYQTAFTAPHFKAAQVGQSILDAGGTASEAMVAAAAMVAVQYPHMNSLGGDGFWLICKPGQPPVAIDACGAAAANVDIESYRKTSSGLPDAGGRAAITMAGTVSGWQKALQINSSGKSLTELLQAATDSAEQGIIVTQSLQDASEKTLCRLREQSAFGETFLSSGNPLKVGERLINKALAETFRQLAKKGLDDFYRGDLAKQMAEELIAAGSPLTLADFHDHYAKVTAPLTVETSKGHLYNLGAPTQGLASLLILSIYDRLDAKADTELDHIHLLVEATKQAFIIRDKWICDEDYLQTPLQTLLSDSAIEQCVRDISISQAKPWPHRANPGDTVWMGATDKFGTMVSFIQSIYWEFGSGVLLPGSGIIWNIRSQSFSLDVDHHNALAAGKKPFHTLNPAYAELHDGSRMVYGTMGGEGQPQTQACLFSRYHYQGMSLQDAVAKPRWLLGRTWGDSTNNLRLEQSLFDLYGEALQARGHDVTKVDDNNELMGHAGAILLTEQGQALTTSDPRSDGISLLGDLNDH